VTYMLLLNCALKLDEEIILYYDARSKKHQITKYSVLEVLVHLVRFLSLNMGELFSVVVQKCIYLFVMPLTMMSVTHTIQCSNNSIILFNNNERRE